MVKKKNLDEEELEANEEELAADVKEERRGEGNPEELERDVEKHVSLRQRIMERKEKEAQAIAEADKEYNEEFVKEQKQLKESETEKELKKQTFLGRKSRKGEPISSFSKKEKKSLAKKTLERPVENINAELERKNLERLQSGIEREQKIVQSEREEQEAIAKAEEKKAELDLKIKEAEMKEQVAKTELESVEKKKTEQEKRIESRIKQLDELIPVAKKKDIEKAEELLQEKGQLQSDLERVKSSPEDKSGYDIREDSELARFGLIPKDTGLTESEKKLEENRNRKEKIQQILDEKREVLSETAKQKLEKEKLELQRREFKLQKEARIEREASKKAIKLKRLQEKKDKLQVKKDIITLKAQRKIQARTIQDKRRELLQKNLAFIATRGAVRLSKQYIERQRAKQRQSITKDSMLVSTPDGESKKLSIGEEGIPDPEEYKGFDLIKELTGEDDSSPNDPVSKKIKLL